MQGFKIFMTLITIISKSNFKLFYQKEKKIINTEIFIKINIHFFLKRSSLKVIIYLNFQGKVSELSTPIRLE